MKGVGMEAEALLNHHISFQMGMRDEFILAETLEEILTLQRSCGN
jgi:hypothetical protein